MTANRTRAAAAAKKGGAGSDSGSTTSRRSPAKKSTAKKSTAKKSTAKKSTAKKAAAKKSTAKKSTPHRSAANKSTADRSTADSSTASSGRESGGGRRSARSAPKAESRRRAIGTEVASEAARQLLQLTGKAAEGITGLERADHGWTVQVEVVEVRRIPDTTDVLALYEVTTDEQGELEGYRRLRRYVRGAPGEDWS